jgi:hypothetical protein
MMNKIVNMAEAGPISDFIVTDDQDKDVLMLNMGFRLVASSNGLRLWVCRMCNGDFVVEDVWLMEAPSESEALEKVMKENRFHEEERESFKMYEMKHAVWLVFKMTELIKRETPVIHHLIEDNLQTLVYTLQIVETKREQDEYTTFDPNTYKARG